MIYQNNLGSNYATVDHIDRAAATQNQSVTSISRDERSAATGAPSSARSKPPLNLVAPSPKIQGVSVTDFNKTVGNAADKKPVDQGSKLKLKLNIKVNTRSTTSRIGHPLRSLSRSTRSGKSAESSTGCAKYQHIKPKISSFRAGSRMGSSNSIRGNENVLDQAIRAQTSGKLER